MHVGVAGLGRMGAAIATRLLQCGHKVSVWNRSDDKTKPLIALGADVHASPVDLARNVDAILTMLTDADAVDSVYRSPSGILEADLSGKIVIEMSTVSPAVEIALAADVESQGGMFVECPVGGTIGTTLAGNLVGFAGGRTDHVERARPILDKLCRRIEHVGPAGAGASMKLAINLPLATYWQSLGEAYSLCRHLNLSPGLLVELFAESSAGPNILRMCGPDVARAFEGGATPEPPFDCDLLRKDLRTMIEDAKGRDFSLPLGARVLEIYDDASAVGWGERAGWDLAAYWTQSGNAHTRSRERG
jgi:3-hydroxyisobutyrate dehydrogenase